MVFSTLLSAVMLLNLYFLETPCTRRLKLVLCGEGKILVRFTESPSVEEAAQMLLGLVGSGEEPAAAGGWNRFAQELMQQKLAAVQGNVQAADEGAHRRFVVGRFALQLAHGGQEQLPRGLVCYPAARPPLSSP